MGKKKSINSVQDVNLKMIEQGWDVKRFWVHEIRDNLDYCIYEIINWKNKHSVHEQ